MAIGQHFILGFKGTTVPTWLQSFAAEFGLGGVILFDYDVHTKQYGNNIQSPSQLSELCASIHNLPGRPLIFIDQEGGKVRRLKEKVGFRPLPSHQQLVKLPSDEKRRVVEESFSEMKMLGIDVDLAPVIDINYNPKNPDIGAIERSFSSDAKVVAEHARLFFDCAKKVSLKLCLKHYPGLGGATTNSHESLTDITDSVTEEQCKLFFELGREVPGQMVLLSHGIVRTWDPELPTTVSKSAIGDLRASLPKGILISDDLQMEGLQAKMTSEEAVVRGLSAGLDYVIIGNNLLDEQNRMKSIAEFAAHKKGGRDV